MNEIVNVADEMAVIGADTRIKGNIVTNGHLTVDGTVTGDICAAGDLIVTGNIKGKIKCRSLMVQSGKVQSDIKASGAVVIRENAYVNGNIVCRDIAVMGVIRGDVQAETIGVEPGARIEGVFCIR